MPTRWFQKVLESSGAESEASSHRSWRFFPEEDEHPLLLEEPKPAPIVFNRRELQDDVRDELAHLAGEAADCLGTGQPPAEATWSGRTAVIFAEAARNGRAKDLLERARRLSRVIWAGAASAEVLGDVAQSNCIAGYAMQDVAVFRGGLALTDEIPTATPRALCLAKVFLNLAMRGDQKVTWIVKRRLMKQLFVLDPGPYALTVAEVVPILARSAEARSEIVDILAEASRRSRLDRLTVETTRRDVGILFARAARELRDSSLLRSAREFAITIYDPRIRAPLLGEMAVAYAELGDPLVAREMLDRLHATVFTIDGHWERRSAERQLLETSAVVGAVLHDEPSLARIEEELARADDRDRDLAILHVSGAVARYAERTRDADAMRRAIRCAARSSDGSIEFAQAPLEIRGLMAMGRPDEAHQLLNRARAWSRTVESPLERCRAVLAVARAVLDTGLVPDSA